MLASDTPLIDAVRSGRVADVLALLADGADVNEPQTDGVTALYIASQEGHAEIATELLFANADVDQAITEGDTRRRKGGARKTQQVGVRERETGTWLGLSGRVAENKSL